MSHPPVDDGSGTCLACGRKVALYAGKAQHRRGPIPGVSQGKRLPQKRAPRCPNCKSAGPLQRFILLVEQELASPSRAVVRKVAGVAHLCQPCWRKITARP